jgi:hypothetical protein
MNTTAMIATQQALITSKEIRAMLTEFVKKSGVPFREKGGTYFVARRFRTELKAFRELLPLIHRDNYMRWMPIAGIGDMDIIARQSLTSQTQYQERHSFIT